MTDDEHELDKLIEKIRSIQTEHGEKVSALNRRIEDLKLKEGMAQDKYNIAIQIQDEKYQNVIAEIFEKPQENIIKKILSTSERSRRLAYLTCIISIIIATIMTIYFQSRSNDQIQKINNDLIDLIIFSENQKLDSLIIISDCIKSLKKREIQEFDIQNIYNTCVGPKLNTRDYLKLVYYSFASASINLSRDEIQMMDLNFIDHAESVLLEECNEDDLLDMYKLFISINPNEPSQFVFKHNPELIIDNQQTKISNKKIENLARSIERNIKHITTLNENGTFGGKNKLNDITFYRITFSMMYADGF